MCWNKIDHSGHKIKLHIHYDITSNAYLWLFLLPFKLIGKIIPRKLIVSFTTESETLSSFDSFCKSKFFSTNLRNICQSNEMSEPITSQQNLIDNVNESRSSSPQRKLHILQFRTNIIHWFKNRDRRLSNICRFFSRLTSFQVCT